MNHLRIFGCTAFALVPKDERKKFDCKARKCFFLGHGHKIKCYRLYDPERRRVFHNRDEIFHERFVEFDYALEKPGQDEESKYCESQQESESRLITTVNG